MPVCDLCLDLAKHDVWIRCVEWKFPWQRDFKAGRRVTYSFYRGNRNTEATWGALREDTESSEFSSDCKDLGPRCLLPHPPLLFEIIYHPSFAGGGEREGKIKEVVSKGRCLCKICRQDYKRKVHSLHREKQLYWSNDSATLTPTLAFSWSFFALLCNMVSLVNQLIMKSSWATFCVLQIF